MSSSATPSEKEKRILIADDHPIAREGLSVIFALEDDLKVVGQARDGEEACLLYHQLSPDILILDLRMPKKDWFQPKNANCDIGAGIPRFYPNHARGHFL